MKVYFDLLTKEELFSDAYQTNIVDEVMYRVESRWIVKAGSGGSSGNEDAPQDPNSITVNEIVDKYDFTKVHFKKKEYITSLKKYMKKVLTRLQSQSRTEEHEIFKKYGPKFVKKITSSFKEWEFFYTQAVDQGMIVLQKYDDESITPHLYFWKHGCRSAVY